MFRSPKREAPGGIRIYAVYELMNVIHYLISVNAVLGCNKTQEERLTFDQQLSALERTVRVKENELKELELLSST